ncbi:O-antigen ligase family protein [Sphingomonas oryzagri]
MEGRIARERFLVWLVVLVFILGGVLGGGRTSPNISMFVELPAAFLVAIGLAGLIDGHYPREARTALALLALICLVPLLQLIPLPSRYWGSLPGHAIPAEISRLVGLGEQARPLSLSPEATQLDALSLIVPVAIFITTLQLGVASRDRLLLVVVGFAFVSAVLGVFQTGAGGGIHLDIYPQVHEGYPIGFFANRNHEGDLLLIALPAAAQVIRAANMRETTKISLMIGAVLFFSLAVVSTQSRTAAALLPLALGGTLAVWIGNLRDKRIWIGFAVLVAAVVVSLAVVELTPVGHRLLMRFTTIGDDLRPAIWKNTWVAAGAFWPTGSGVGSFVPVYQMFEDLNSVQDAWVNHAHNDYLEILLETGIAGIILIAAYVVIAGLTLFSEAPRPLRGQRYVAVSMIAILMAHSLTDYPLRTFGLLSIFALANGMLFLPRERLRVRRRGSYPASPSPAFAPGT